jgi:uncharacterized membrane protein
MEKVDRRVLSRAKLSNGSLSPEAMYIALNLTGMRPGPAEWRDFTVRAMQFAGVLSLAAGMVFLVAFNWQHLGLYAHFAMVEAPLLAALVVAWIYGADRLSGKLALTLAVLLTGALLALFGQTYQTGADVYELFLGWALLALPWVLACRYAPCWALWLLLANAAVSLYVGTPGHGWLAGLFLDRWRWSPWALPFLLNLLLYVTIVSLSRWPELGLGENWLRRGVMALAMAFGTVAMLYVVFGDGSSSASAAVIEVLLFLVASAAFAAHAYFQKEDLFNFAVLAFSWIVITTSLIGRTMLEAGIGSLFIIGLYLIGVSTAAVKGISYLGRQWKVEEPAA